MWKKSLVVLSFVAFVAGKPKVNGLKPQAFWDPQFCLDDPSLEIFPDDLNCNQYWQCDDFGDLIEGFCPDDFPVFDSVELFCGTADDAICDYEDNTDPDPDPDPDFSECPLDTNDITFLPGDYCDEYYICVNGVPNLFACRDGQHWNAEWEYCDDPHKAGCDEDAAIDHPATLPDCLGFVGTLPHPSNCNWFIYCNHGSRSIQQCQHLLHYDVNLNQCVMFNMAQCVTNQTQPIG